MIGDGCVVVTILWVVGDYWGGCDNILGGWG